MRGDKNRTFLKKRSNELMLAKGDAAKTATNTKGTKEDYYLFRSRGVEQEDLSTGDVMKKNSKQLTLHCSKTFQLQIRNVTSSNLTFELENESYNGSKNLINKRVASYRRFAVIFSL